MKNRNNIIEYIYLSKKNRNRFATVLLMFFVLNFFMVKNIKAEIVNPVASSLATTGQLTVGKVAPGEQLPLQVQLINFGTPNERVDVTLMYSVKNKKNIILLSNSETVAVETTSSFIKNILIPSDFQTGTYSIDLLMAYRGQEFPAISQAKFKVKNKYFGFYSDDWVSAFPAVFVPFIFMFFWLRRKKVEHALRPHYDNIEEEDRVYYEIVHDIIVCLQKHVGDNGIKKIVSHIDGLTLDESNLFVTKLEGAIEDVISQLIYEYEEIIGKKANVITCPVYPKNRVRTH